MDVYNQISEQLSQNPFTELIPFLLDEVRIVFQEKSWLLSDPDRKGFTIANTDEACWRILAFTNGKPFSCFGVYENEQFYIHTLWTNHKMYSVNDIQ